MSIHFMSEASYIPITYYNYFRLRNLNNIIKRVCQKSQVVRPEGAKAPSQGQRPGCNVSQSKAPCKGKSVHYQRFCPYRALCLQQHSFTFCHPPPLCLYTSQLFMQGKKHIQWDVDNSLFHIFGVGQQACTQG